MPCCALCISTAGCALGGQLASTSRAAAAVLVHLLWCTTCRTACLDQSCAVSPETAALLPWVWQAHRETQLHSPAVQAQVAATSTYTRLVGNSIIPDIAPRLGAPSPDVVAGKLQS